MSLFVLDTDILTLFERGHATVPQCSWFQEGSRSDCRGLVKV